MLTPIINRQAGRITMVPPAKPTTSMSRNAGTVSLISERVAEQLVESLSSKQGGTYYLKVRLVDTGDIRGFECGFLPEIRTQ